MIFRPASPVPAAVLGGDSATIIPRDDIRRRRIGDRADFALARGDAASSAAADLFVVAFDHALSANRVAATLDRLRLDDFPLLGGSRLLALEALRALFLARLSRLTAGLRPVGTLSAFGSSLGALGTRFGAVVGGPVAVLCHSWRSRSGEKKQDSKCTHNGVIQIQVFLLFLGFALCWMSRC
jgi:hypothetical protein